MPALSFNNASAAPWGYTLIEDIALSLNAGEVAGIIGPNGAGKSSLLKMVTGEIGISSGSIDILDKNASEWTPQSRARVMAFLPQLSLLNFPYTVEEVIHLGRTPHSSGRREDSTILSEVMSATDTLRLMGRTYTQLSGGEKQRVQLARVFAQIWREDVSSSRLLLLDEPTTALDLAHQQLIMEAIATLAATGCAVLMVAHDFNLIAAAADQIIALDQGKQIAAGPPKTVMSAEVFDTVFATEVAIVAHPRTGKPVVIPL